MASSLQGLLGETPGQQEGHEETVLNGESNDTEMSQGADAVIHQDTPFQHSAEPLLSPQRSTTEGMQAEQLATQQQRLSESSRRVANDDAEEFSGIPIPEEGDGYGMTDDEDSDSNDTIEDISGQSLTPEDLIRRLRQGHRLRDATGDLNPEGYGLMNPSVVIPAMERIIRERRRSARQSLEVRSVLECQRSGTQLVVLHPRGSWIKYRPSGRVYLASVGHQPLAGVIISKAMTRHLRGTKVLVHGGVRGALEPTIEDYASAPYVNRRTRQHFSRPRAVRWYADGPTSTAHCDWTTQEWDDFRLEIADGHHPTLQSPPLSWPTNVGRVQATEGSHHSSSSGGATSSSQHAFCRDGVQMHSSFIREHSTARRQDRFGDQREAADTSGYVLFKQDPDDCSKPLIGNPRVAVDTSAGVILEQDPEDCTKPLRTGDSSKQRRPRRRDSLYAQQAGLQSTLSPPPVLPHSDQSQGELRRRVKALHDEYVAALRSSAAFSSNDDCPPDVSTVFIQDQVARLRAAHPVLQLGIDPALTSSARSLPSQSSTTPAPPPLWARCADPHCPCDSYNGQPEQHCSPRCRYQGPCPARRHSQGMNVTRTHPPQATLLPLSTTPPPVVSPASTFVSGGGPNLTKMVGELSKLSDFSGQQADFKVWEQELRRVAAVNDLEITLDPLYRPGEPRFDARHNKILYFLIQRAVEHSVEAHAHFQKAAQFDGNHAYFLLRDAYVFAAHAEGALLLQRLNAMRLEVGESLTMFGIRLGQLFSELEGLEGDHAMRFTETQKLSRLLTILHREPHLEAAYIYLQGEMTRGTMTYALAMKNLQLQCESMRADEALESAAPQRHSSGVRRGYYADTTQVDVDVGSSSQVSALVTTQNKRHFPQSQGSTVTGGAQHRQPTNASAGTVCLVAGCTDKCALPVCRLHYASLLCGKETHLTLRNGYGKVTYDKGKNAAVYPSTVPADLLLRVGGRPRTGPPKA